MNAYHDVRTPLFKLFPDVADAPLMNKIARLGPDLIDNPIDIFHPMLLVLQDPVVHFYKLIGYVVRFLDGLDYPNRRRTALPKTRQPVRYRLRRRAMPAAGVG